MKSELAAPNPLANPERRPRLNVRCMHKTPIGPRGIDARKPIVIPLNKNINNDDAMST